MKKIFTLTMLLTLAMTVNAQTYRKSWNFTKWSATTVANVVADPNWTDDEKGDNYASKPATGSDCQWEITPAKSDDGFAVANGEVIEELQGLTYLNTKSKGLAIASNYPDCTARDGDGFGPYNGSQYLWLCSKSNDYFVLPHVELGTTIKMGIESHKFSSSRGVTLKASGTSIGDPVDAEGNTVSGGNVTNYRDLTWTVPTDIEATNDDGTVDITITCNSGGGMHIYYITVGEGDEPQTVDAKKVAYLYNGDLDADLAYIFLAGATDVIDLTPIEVTTEITQETLSEYEAVVFAPSIENPASLRNLIAFIPVVNLTASNYNALGLGINKETETNILTIADASNAIFEGMDETVEYDGAINGAILGEYFANDAVLAKADEVVAIHAHNPGRNAYYLIPVENASEPIYTMLLPQTVVTAAKTKRDIISVATPIISVKQEDGASIVTITAANSTKIFYTTDGTDPTTESQLYTEPFTVTEACTVKAFGTGDGFYDSEITAREVAIATKAAAPEFTLTREEGKTMVTLTSDTEGVEIYYNFVGQNATTASVKYAEPFEVTTPCKVYAFADAAKGILASDLAEMFVGVDGINKDNIRWDVVAHFNANADDWKGKGQQTNDAGEIINANYFFTWGKSAGQYWDETSEQVQKVDEDGDLVYDEDGNPVMTYTKTLAPETFEANGWIIKSIGQVMVWESLSIGWNIGDTSMRNPDTAEDAIGVNDEEGITANAITFGKQPTDGPFNATLGTTAKIAGPFDVVVYAGNGNEGETPTMQIEVSTDGENWTKLGDVNFSLIKRNWKKTVLNFEESSEVYVRLLHTAAKSSGQIYDIYVMKNGEKSAKYSEGGIKGDVNGDGLVTVADITAVINVITGADMQYEKTADVNNDGIVTIADITEVINNIK